MEIWKDIPGYEGKYQVSNYGNIYSLRYKRHRKLMKDRYGYSFVGLNADGKQHFFLVHRLVAEVFVQNPKLKPEVNHIDGNKLNNHTDNLEWVDRNENMSHAHRSGLIVRKAKAPKPHTKKAQRNFKLTTEQVRQIREEYAKGECGYKKLAKKYNVDRMLIKRIVQNEIYKKTG